MKVLVVEDEDPKRLNIVSALVSMHLDMELFEAKSVNSAIKQLRQGTPDLIVLDMSLPTFDVGPKESGGRPQGFGGVEVLRYIDRFGMTVPVIVVTAYEAFAKGSEQIDLKVMKAQLVDAHPNIFKGAVYYNSVFETWREELSQLVLGVFPK